ncbi:tetratricopeptide repeat protein [archaeon]
MRKKRVAKAKKEPIPDKQLLSDGNRRKHILKLYKKAKSLLENSECEKALEHSNQILSIDAKNLGGLHMKGFALYGLGRLDESVACFQKATEIKPDSDTAWFCIGGALEDKGQLEEALKHYKKAVRLNPQNGLNHGKLGALLAKLGKHEEAVQYYTSATRINPNNASYWANLSQSLGLLGRFEEALTACNKSLEIAPEHEQCLKNKKVILDRMKAQKGKTTKMKGKKAKKLTGEKQKLLNP